MVYTWNVFLNAIRNTSFCRICHACRLKWNEPVDRMILSFFTIRDYPQPVTTKKKYKSDEDETMIFRARDKVGGAYHR